MTENIDIAGEKYWTEFWKNMNLPPPLAYTSGKINDYPNTLLHRMFSEILKMNISGGKEFLEIGCGNSIFLSYFAKVHGYKVSGIDYSEQGCEQTRRILKRDNIEGRIYHDDVFHCDPSLTGTFDVVCSLGVVEHFKDTSATLRSFSRFLKPDGLLITSIPNLAGATGFLQKKMNKPVYDIHVVMNKPEFEKRIVDAGLELVFSKYFLGLSFAVTLEGHEGRTVPYYDTKKTLLKILRTGSKMIWLAEKLTAPLPAGKLFSGGIMTAARKMK
ncbi:MAG: class I SAM-dependent methyltransferase [Bacteroidia bacterium]|nr:class I SAM-dependent methyltransferase [Bacteroidia bacterium]